MTPTEAMNDLLQAVERETGRPAVVEADPTLPLAANVTTGRGSSPLHVIRYRAAFEPERAYLVSYQCGFLLRSYRTPSHARFELAATTTGRAEVERLLRDHFRGQGQSLPPAVLSGLRDRMFDGIMLQLRSMPVGLRVDAWLAATYPGLAEQQRVAVVRQLNENAQALGPEVRAVAPAKILTANLGMNAAFASFFARLWKDPLLTQPYRTAGQLAAGEQLLTAFDTVSGEPEGDRDLIDSWGRALQLTGWYNLPTPTA